MWYPETVFNDCAKSVTNLKRFARLPRAWLTDCNENHYGCRPKQVVTELPRRLIYVSKAKQRIVETSELHSNKEAINYIALSHKWGQMPEGAVTTTTNIEDRMVMLSYEAMPLSFKHAITITIALGYNYLWIDSLCILQGPDGDFNENADKMQTTFSGADCVLAACSAEYAGSGFLNARLPGVNIGEVYVAADTEDFERDVLRSPLQQRGWVLQERALARRTIFFTNTQMYWECGDGIRTETLVKFKK